jgi:hypothetical protein
MGGGFPPRVHPTPAHHAGMTALDVVRKRTNLFKKLASDFANGFLMHCRQLFTDQVRVYFVILFYFRGYLPVIFSSSIYTSMYHLSTIQSTQYIPP